MFATDFYVFKIFPCSSVDSVAIKQGYRYHHEDANHALLFHRKFPFSYRPFSTNSCANARTDLSLLASRFLLSVYFRGNKSSPLMLQLPELI
jgi:hypothetical protein